MATSSTQIPVTSASGKSVSRGTTSGFWPRLWGTVRSRLWRIGISALLLAAVLAFVYWRFLAPIPVRSHEVQTGEIFAEIMGTGTLEAHVKVTISSKISGRLDEVLVDQGDLVKAGQVLARLDDRDLREQVEVEKAIVSARKATVERLIADKNFAKSTLVLAEKTYTRAQKLLGTKAISQEDYDRAVGAFTTGEAGMEKAEAALVEGQKLLIAAEKTLEFHQAKLADTVIKAPFDGLIVRRDRDAGDVVVPGTSVLLLVSLEELWISAWVDETRMGKLKPDQPASVVFRSEPSASYPGKVIRVGKETDRETREFLVDVRPKKLPQYWSIGQRAEVYIETGRKSQGVLVPSLFLTKRDGQTGVFVAREGRAQWRPLTIGLQGRDMVEASDGIAPGEIIVMPADPKGRHLTEGSWVILP